MEKVGNIGNYYGGLYIKTDGDKFYWIIEDYATNFDNIREWSEISETLYNELKKQNSHATH